MNHVWSKDARDELMKIISYIKRNSGKINAEKVYNKICDEIKKVSSNAAGRRVSPILKKFGIRDIHEMIITPWMIYYRVDGNVMKIISIIDGRRNLEEILYQKIMDGKTE